MKDHWKITGIIVGGVKKGAFFTQLEWVQEQCLKKLGFNPYPGTLNLKVSSVEHSSPKEHITDWEQLAYCGGTIGS